MGGGMSSRSGPITTPTEIVVRLTQVQALGHRAVLRCISQLQSQHPENSIYTPNHNRCTLEIRMVNPYSVHISYLAVTGGGFHVNVQGWLPANDGYTDLIVRSLRPYHYAGQGSSEHGWMWFILKCQSAFQLEETLPFLMIRTRLV
jgi:hypothetical protein